MSIRFRPDRNDSQRPEPGYCWRQTATVRVAMLTRHAVSVMNRRAVQIKFSDSSSKDVSRALAAFVRALTAPLEPLGEGPRCIRQRRTCTTEVIAPIPSVTIICGRYCADSPQHES